MGTITGKFHQNPLKSVGETRLCLRTDGRTEGRTDGRTDGSITIVPFDLRRGTIKKIQQFKKVHRFLDTLCLLAVRKQRFSTGVPSQALTRTLMESRLYHLAYSIPTDSSPGFI